MKIVVGSMSEIKLAAVRDALARAGRAAEVLSAATEPGVPAQPLGDETFAGARARARQAGRAHPGAWSVGIENGLFFSRDGWQDKAVLVLRSPDESERLAFSASVAVPNAVIAELKRRMRRERITVGGVLAERTGCDHQDSHAFLTNGRTDRQAILTEALTQLFRDVLPEKENA